MVINSWVIPKPVIFRTPGLGPCLAGPDREVVRMMAAEGTAAAMLQSIGTRAAAICSLPLPEKFLRSQGDLRDGEDLVYDETQAARRAFGIALKHKEKDSYADRPAKVRNGKRRQKATVVGRMQYFGSYTHKLKARNGPTMGPSPLCRAGGGRFKGFTETWLLPPSLSCVTASRW